LPRIYEEVTRQKFPKVDEDGGGLRADDWTLLKEICGDDQAFFDLQVALLGIERTYRGLSRRSGADPTD
jgi:DNA sulfur modification protein DndC